MPKSFNEKVNDLNELYSSNLELAAELGRENREIIDERNIAYYHEEKRLESMVSKGFEELINKFDMKGNLINSFYVKYNKKAIGFQIGINKMTNQEGREFTYEIPAAIGKMLMTEMRLGKFMGISSPIKKVQKFCEKYNVASIGPQEYKINSLGP